MPEHSPSVLQRAHWTLLRLAAEQRMLARYKWKGFVYWRESAYAKTQPERFRDIRYGKVGLLFDAWAYLAQCADYVEQAKAVAKVAARRCENASSASHTLCLREPEHRGVHVGRGRDGRYFWWGQTLPGLYGPEDDCARLVERG